MDHHQLNDKVPKRRSGNSNTKQEETHISESPEATQIRIDMEMLKKENADLMIDLKRQNEYDLQRGMTPDTNNAKLENMAAEYQRLMEAGPKGTSWMTRLLDTLNIFPTAIHYWFLRPSSSFRRHTRTENSLVRRAKSDPPSTSRIMSNPVTHDTPALQKSYSKTGTKKVEESPRSSSHQWEDSEKE